MRTLLGRRATASWCSGAVPTRRSSSTRCCPADAGRFPWGGHLGLSRCCRRWSRRSSASGTTLVFTNMRSQAEIWYQALLEARPDWAGADRAAPRLARPRGARVGRARAEGTARCKAVVCTSSLDLGVDFLPVERVLQIGSAKGVARLLQRAGRSGHAPGRASRASRWCRRTRSSWSRRRPRARAVAGRPHRGARRARASRSTCWCSTW